MPTESPAQTWRSFQKLSASALVGFVALAQSVRADDLPFPPLQKVICTSSHIVNKDALAEYLLKKYPLSIGAVPSSIDANLKGGTARRILTQDLLSAPLCSRANCSETDKKSLASINGNLLGLLSGAEELSFKPTDSLATPAKYLSGDNEDEKIECVVTANGDPVEAPGAFFHKPETGSFPFRIRGKADQLYIDRSQKKDFAATDKATIDFTDDQVAKTRTDKFVAAVGYNIPTNFFRLGPGGRLDLVPYIATNRNIINVSSGKSSKPNTETVDFGLLGSTYLVTGAGMTPIGHVINIRPDYLLDLEGDSRLFTMNLQYLPVINSYINSFCRVVPGRDDIASVKPIFDIRADLGDYTDRGKASVAGQNKDFARFGGQAGIAIVSDSSFLPADLSSTYTGLYAAAGQRDIGDSKTTLTYNLDPSKYFGISVSYLNGVREDTAKREQQWEVALSVRY